MTISEALKAAIHRNGYSTPSNALFSGMVNSCIEQILQEYDEKLIMSAWGRGDSVAPGFYEEAIKIIEETGLLPIFVSNSEAGENLEDLEDGSSIVYASVDKHIVIVLRWSPDEDLKDENNPKIFGGFSEFQIVEPFSKDKTSLASKIKKLFDKYVAPEKSYIYTIVTHGQGFGLETLGIGGIPLVRENYSTEVQEAYEQIVSDLKSSEPLGRLSIINGPPGTGKTYLVRALVDDVPECKFVIVPPHLVSHLGDPQFLAFFIQERSNSGDAAEGKPLVLVLEDADQCLTERAADNMASVSAILNLTDGIIGSLINFRIVATTNAKTVALDPALTRPGRLSAAMTIGELDRDHICDIYMRLTKSDDVAAAREATVNCSTLADVYAVAKGAKKDKKKAKSKVVGFGR